MECVCLQFRGWMGKTKDVSVFLHGRMDVGARRTSSNVSRTATLLAFSRSAVSFVYEEWSTTQRTSSQHDTTVGSIGVNVGQSRRWTHALTYLGRFEGKTGWNSMLWMFYLCGVHSVYFGADNRGHWYLNNLNTSNTPKHILIFS